MFSLKPENLEKYVSLARNILIDVAKGKRGDKFITYRGLMEEMGGPGRGYIAEVLEEVSCREQEQGRPLLTALVVHKTDGLPGYGFWYIKTLPDSVKNASDIEKIAFWEKKCKTIWEYWEKHSS